jgi:hypothetical protein
LHALIGAGALAVHGVSRSTLDHDILVVDRKVLEAGFWEPLGSDANVDARPGDADDPLGGVVRLTARRERDVDVVVGRHSWQADMLTRAMRVGEQQLPVVQRVDLILLKLYAGGSQDRWDIEQLLALAPRADVTSEVEARVDVLPPSGRALWVTLRDAR